MKGNLAMKILGIGVTLTVVAGLLVGITAAPVGAQPATLGWGIIETPSNVNNILGGYNESLPTPAPMSNPVINLVAASPTGSVVFGWDFANKTLYTSTNGGASWATTLAVPTTAISNVPVALVVSPNYATDNSLALATNAEVFISNNGGASFTNISPPAATLGTEVITSLDLGYWFTTSNVLTALIGLANPDGAAGVTGTNTSNVLEYTYGAFGWTSIANATGVTTGPLTNSVYAVKFSNHAISDGEIMCAYYIPTTATTNPGSLWISSDFGSLGWNNAAYPDNAIVGAPANGSALTTPLTQAPLYPYGVTIALASDYVGNTGASIFVGINATTAANGEGLWRVSGRANGPGSTVTESLTEPVSSLVVSGPIATATVFVGIVDAGISWTNTSTASPPTWSAPTTAPYGVNPSLSVGGTMLYVGTQSGTAAGNPGGISVSSDMGVSFQGIGVMNCGATFDLTLEGVYPASATTMFVTMNNATTGEQYVFRTTNGGTSWQRVFVSVVPIATTPLMVAVSGAYATDSTVVISDGTSLLHESTNGGSEWLNVGSAGTKITSIWAINASNIFAGTSGGIYKVGSFALGATETTGTLGNVVSFALNPMDKTLATFAIGQSDGTVWQTTNGGTTFTELGASLGAANALVAYGPDGTPYAAVSVTPGTVWSYSASALAWTQINAPTSIATGVLSKPIGISVSPGGTLYVGDASGANLVTRSLNPNQEYNATAPGAPTFCTMNFGTPLGTGVTDTLSSMAVLSGAAANTVYVVDSTSPAQTGYGYSGCLEGFSDTFTAAPAGLTPANNATVSFPGTTPAVTLSWKAITGATGYQVYVNGYLMYSSTSDLISTTTNSFVFTGTNDTVACLSGTAYTWSVNAYGVATTGAGMGFLGIPSATLNFTTALAPIPVSPATLYPAQGQTDVPLSGWNFVWPADATDTNAGITVTYQFVLAAASANTAANEFAIIDYSDNTATNVDTLTETLAPNAQYWWEVRSVYTNSSGGLASYSAWSINTFTTAAGPATTSMTTVTVTPTVTPTFVLPTQTVTPTTVVVTNTTTTTQPIPSYLLWAVIAVGAILVIAVIVLIVRTRRMP